MAPSSHSDLPSNCKPGPFCHFPVHVSLACVRLYVWVQHGCGFAAWNSTLDSYPYSANKAPHPIDVVRPFVASAQAAGVGYGFYYSECSFFCCHGTWAEQGALLVSTGHVHVRLTLTMPSYPQALSATKCAMCATGPLNLGALVN